MGAVLCRAQVEDGSQSAAINRNQSQSIAQVEDGSQSAAINRNQSQSIAQVEDGPQRRLMLAQHGICECMVAALPAEAV